MEFISVTMHWRRRCLTRSLASLWRRVEAAVVWILNRLTGLTFLSEPLRIDCGLGLVPGLYKGIIRFSAQEPSVELPRAEKPALRKMLIAIFFVSKVPDDVRLHESRDLSDALRNGVSRFESQLICDPCKRNAVVPRILIFVHKLD